MRLDAVEHEDPSAERIRGWLADLGEGGEGDGVE